MKYIFLSLLSTFFVGNIYAQQTAYTSSITTPQETFAEKNNTQYFSGLLDDLYQVRIQLDCSTGECSGQLVYTESGVQFRLEGIKLGDQLLLKEINQQSEISGFIKATWNDQQITGEWSNFDGTIGSAIELQSVEKEATVHTLGQDKWVKTYKGVVAWEEVEMVLHHLGHQHVTGFVYNFANDDEHVITGQINQNGVLELSIQNAAGIEKGTLVGKDIDDKNFRAEYKNNENERSYASFELTNKIPVGYIEYANYVMNYEVLFPEYTNNTFNVWIKDYLQNWVSDCRSTTQQLNKKVVLQPEDRASERGYVWFNIEESLPDFISGYYFYSNTWNHQTIGKSLNYDLVSNKSIEWKDVFKKSATAELNNFKQQYIEKEIRRNPQYMDTAFQEWIHTQTFPLFAFQQNGIQFSTIYDEVFGQTKITISYEDLKPFMKKKNPINRLF